MDRCQNWTRTEGPEARNKCVFYFSLPLINVMLYFLVFNHSFFLFLLFFLKRRGGGLWYLEFCPGGVWNMRGRGNWAKH